MRRLVVHDKPGPHNSLWYWHHHVAWWRVAVNFVVISLTRILPSLTLKNVLLRLLGMKVGRNVSVGLMVMFDIFRPDLIELDDNCIIGYNTTILAHEFLVDKYCTGKVRIGKNVMIGANTTVLAGVEIGDNSVVSAMSLVNRDVSANSMVGGIPAREIARKKRHETAATLADI